MIYLKKNFHLENTAKIRNKFHPHMLHLKKMHKDSWHIMQQITFALGFVHKNNWFMM